MSASKEISSILAQIIKSKSNKNVSKKMFDKDLYKQGIVDSFDILNLLTEFENKFSIRIDPVKIKGFTFSISFLSRLIYKLKNK
jgi:acyl carrier protein